MIPRIAYVYYLCIKRGHERFTGICALAEALKCFYRYWYCEHIPARTMMNQDVTLYFYNSQGVSACISSN